MARATDAFDYALPEAAIAQQPIEPRDSARLLVGETLDDRTFRDLPDLLDPTQQVSSKDMLGQPWLLNVWGTWCPECWKEHDYLLHLARREGVPIIGINWRDDAAEAKAMLARLGNPFYKIGFDPHSDAVIEWGVYGAPETFLIDAQGIVREKHKGAMASEVWKDKFQAYFSESGDAS